MENNRHKIEVKNRKNSAEFRSIKLVFENSSDSFGGDIEKKKTSKQNGHKLLAKYLGKTKKYKSTEKRKRKESKEEQEKKKPRKLTYMEKYKRSEKPRETFQSTSKNPKINEILRKLRESEEKANASSYNSINVGKIDTNKINKFMGNRDSRVNYGENNMYDNKVKNYVDKLNKIVGERTSSEKNKKKGLRIKKNLKGKEYVSDSDEEFGDWEYSSSSSSSEEDEEQEEQIRKRKKKNRKNKKKNIQLFQEYNENAFYVSGKDQEKYLYKKSNINYTKFNFKSIKLKDKKYKEKEKSDSTDYIPKHQTSFSILNENSKQSTNIHVNFINNNKIYNTKNNKSILKKKRKSGIGDENEGNGKVKFYDIRGYDNKKKTMSIFDILKKRKISIISESPFFKNMSKNKSIKSIQKEKNKEMPIIEEETRPEIHKYNENVNYMIFPTVTNIKKEKKFNLNDFVISKIADIELTYKEKPKVIENKTKYLMVVEKKNDIEIVAEKKSGSNSIHKIRNSFSKINKENKDNKINKENKDNKENIDNKKNIDNKENKDKEENKDNEENKEIKQNKENKDNKEYKEIKQNKENKIINKNPISLIKKKSIKIEPNLKALNIDNKPKINNSLTIKKRTLQNKMNLKRQSKSTERRPVRSSILLDSNSSSKEEEEEEKKKEEKELKELNTNPNILNNKEYDELFRNFATNYKTENKQKRVSRNKIEEINKNINKNTYIRKNNALKNSIESKYMYTDKETNESRALFKQKLRNNKLINEVDEVSKNEIHKVKMNKAKIKKFKSKNILEEKQPNSGIKKNTNLNNRKKLEKTVKIKQFHKQRNNNSDYINNSNIILQNTTVNHTTYNYYLNDQDRSSSRRNNNTRNKK